MAFGFGFGMPRSFAVPPFSPLSLFSGGTPGAWYDPSDYSTLFQDSAGTTPVTAVEQPVGLMLDKSQGLVLGPELFASSIPSGTGWTGTNASAVGNVVTFSAQFGNRRNAQTTEADKWYRFTFKARRISGNTALNIFHENSPSGDYTAFTVTNTVATYQVTVRGRTGGGQVNFGVQDRNASGFGDLEVYDLTVTSLAGNHAFQATSASRPVLSARYNLLTKTEQFDDAAWTKSNVTITANATTAPDGTTTADKVVSNATSAVFAVTQAPTIPLSPVTQSIYAKAAEWSFLNITFDGVRFTGNQYVTFSLSGAGSVSGSSGATGSIQAVGNGWYRCTATATPSTGGAATVRYIPLNFNGGFFPASNGDGTSGIFVWGADLRVSNDGIGLPAYQRVNTATDYATTGFLPYLKFDGVDDSLSTNSISFTSTDKMSVFAGVRKLSDAARGILAELSPDALTNNGSFLLGAPYNTGSNEFKFYCGGTTRTGVDYLSPGTPTTRVITGLNNIATPVVTIRADGVQAATSSSSQGTGNYGNYPLYIGRRANAGLPFNGQLYSMVIVGKAVTAGELTSTETYVNQKTGAY
jgi:hypothetical protein